LVIAGDTDLLVDATPGALDARDARAAFGTLVPAASRRSSWTRDRRHLPLILAFVVTVFVLGRGLVIRQTAGGTERSSSKERQEQTATDGRGRDKRPGQCIERSIVHHHSPSRRGAETAATFS
jgi:hypothetical protein